MSLSVETMQSELQEAMQQALERAQEQLLAKMEKRIQTVANEAIRKAWANEIGRMATDIVEKKIRASDLRPVILERLAHIFTVQLITEALDHIISQRDRNLSYWFQQDLAAAIDEHVRETFQLAAKGR